MKLLKTIWFWLAIMLCLWFVILDNVKADQTFIANNGKSYNGYRTGGKFFIVQDNKPTKAITFTKQSITITGQNCNTNTVQTPTCTVDIDLIDSLINDLQNIKKLQTNSCIDKETIINMIASMNRLNQEGILSSNDTVCEDTTKTKDIEIQTISDIIYIKGKVKYINTFRLAPTGAL